MTFLIDDIDRDTLPEVQLVGTDGNVFAMLGQCTSALESAGRGDLAAELRSRIFDTGYYDEAVTMTTYVTAS